MNHEPICITGIGVATALGTSYRTLADNLLAGRTSIRHLDSFDVKDFACRIGSPMRAIPCPNTHAPADFAQHSLQEQLSLWCCTNALQDAGWWPRRQELRVGLAMGLGAEWSRLWEEDFAQGGRLIDDTEHVIEPHVQKIRRLLGLQGPALALGAACASANYALATARRWLQLGWVDVCLAGACDLNLTPMGLAGFGNLRALSARNDAPAVASRPFDRARDGFVIGEGGAIFVLERASSARQRTAHIYAEVAGSGASSDAHHMVIPSPNPEPATQAMRAALHDARINPSDVDYINAHATSTPVGDIAESRVLQAVLGDAVATTPVSSTKSMTGHMLTAAAAIEAIACIAAMERSAVPPTINLDDPDPECRLCHVPKEAQPRKVRYALSNSFGFGGSNTCVVLRAA